VDHHADPTAKCLVNRYPYAVDGHAFANFEPDDHAVGYVLPNALGNRHADAVPLTQQNTHSDAHANPDRDRHLHDDSPANDHCDVVFYIHTDAYGRLM